ncbi:MAG: RNA polymerase factor sigma-54 [Sulfurimonas sp.]|jgi:RNA polymerase sigma-54 factor|nr:RNA polymerase factor sigma-54 [Sulfurimonadaceae bacterium]
MATLRQTQSVDVKHKLSTTLRSWLPILHSSLSELESTLEPFLQTNPLASLSSGFEKRVDNLAPKKRFEDSYNSSRTTELEALTIKKDSLFEVLDEQINSKLFPTKKSLDIAEFIIQNLDENGYYEGDTKSFCKSNNLDVDEFERVRLRFAYLEPVGVASIDLVESFMFQLDSSDIKDEAYGLARTIINNLQDIHSYSKEPYFSEVMRVINRFKNPPAIEYLEESIDVIADLMIYTDDNGDIEVNLNDEYYPTITIDSDYKIDHEFVSTKLKEAKSLVDALDMRRATLYKIGLMIVEYQYEFFNGGAIAPLTLKTIADEFGHNPSTISRAIANKYIACNRGTFAMKDFFTTAIDEDVSNSAIKEFVTQAIKNENREKPLSDIKLLEMIQEKFKVQMVRRTIAKYRKQLNIAGSSERKKLYLLSTN